MKGKAIFYREVKEDLRRAGYTVFLEVDGELTYTGRVNRPADALAFKGNEVISVEIKSDIELAPGSPPSGASLKYDYSADVREEVKRMIRNGKITPEEGMHMVHINQAKHYAKKLKEGAWGTKGGVSIQGKGIKVGYSIPKNTRISGTVEKVLIDLGRRYKEIKGVNSITYGLDWLPE